MVGPEGVLGVLPTLAVERPVFHSEADVQLALAWTVQRRDPSLRVRLETRPAPGVHLDLAVVDPRDGSLLAVELKYLTDRWQGSVGAEDFRLLRQGAQDIRAYDCVKDVGRVERLVRGGVAAVGLVLVLTNDASYWRSPGHGRVTNADAFRLSEGLVLSGSRGWGPLTGGTRRGRRDVIDLDGRYPLRWHDLSDRGGAGGRFRVLPVVVSPRTALAPIRPPG